MRRESMDGEKKGGVDVMVTKEVKEIGGVILWDG